MGGKGCFNNFGVKTLLCVIIELVIVELDPLVVESMGEDAREPL